MSFSTSCSATPAAISSSAMSVAAASIERRRRYQGVGPPGAPGDEVAWPLRSKWFASAGCVCVGGGRVCVWGGGEEGGRRC